MFRLAMVCLIAGSLTGIPAWAQSSPASFAPIADWEVERDEHSCELRLPLADSDGRVAHFELRQFAPYSSGSDFRFVVYSADVAREYEDIRLRIDPAGEVIDLESAVSVTLGEQGRGIRFRFDYLPEEDRLDALNRGDLPFLDIRDRGLTGFSVLTGFEDALQLATGPLDEPLRLLEPCYDELLASWNIDADAYHTLSRPVLPFDQERWVSRMVQFYPHNMLRQGEDATVHVRLMIDDQGMPDDCHVIDADGHEDFRELVCDLLGRYARFEPALDADGQPLRSFWVTTVHYTIG